MTFKEIYQEYLNLLEKISEKYDELLDTDVRERLHEVINWYLIWNTPIDDDFSKKYAMFSEEGNHLVYQATLNFIIQSKNILENIPVGQQRNFLIEDNTIFTNNGSNYDWFIGSSDEVLPAEKPSPDNLYDENDGY